MSGTGRCSSGVASETDRASFVHANILENLLDGVISVGLGGDIKTFNPAAARILGLDRDDVIGSTLTEALIAEEGYEAFSQAVIDAVMGRSRTERRVVDVERGGERRALSVTTSYLKSPGTGEPVGVIAVFSDITKMQALQQAERRMARELEEQNAELKKSYRMAEASRERLASVLKKVQVARVVATVLVIGVFLGAGVWSWSGLESVEASHASDSAAPSEEGRVDALRTVAVTPEEFTSAISLIGRLAPWREVPVTSAADGHVAEVGFTYGGRVSQGEALLRLDMEETRLEYLDARLEHEKARNAVAELEAWESGTEVAGALRAFSKARMAMERETAALKQSAFLLDEGLIPASQHEDASRRYESQQLDFEAARQDLAAVRARGGEDAKRVAEFDLGKARDRLSAIEATLANDTVEAPISGVILEPARPEQRLVRGREVRKGIPLLTIADFDRMAVVAQVDEVEVTAVRVGQPVTVRGDAFRGLELSGAVSHVASQPGASRSGGAARFAVTVRLDDLGDAQRERLRTGMTVHLRIVTYRNPSALMVPIEAVRVGGGTSRLRVLDEASGEVHEREVEIGLTTLSAVEVTGGLEAGEAVVLSGG